MTPMCSEVAVNYLDAELAGVLVDFTNSELQTKVCHIVLITTTTHHCRSL